MIHVELGSLVILSNRILVCDARGSHLRAVESTKVPTDWVLLHWNIMCSKLAIAAGQNLQSGGSAGLTSFSLPLEGRSL